MELKEGWEPLARFLDVPVPKKEFPRANDAAAADAFTKKLFRRITMAWTAILGTTAVVLWQAIRYWRHGSLGVA
jgi:hypothetical protein